MAKRPSAPPSPPPPPTRRMRGFEPAARLVQDRIRAAGESRGFAMSRLLTHWAEIVGTDVARATRPIKVGFARGGGLGATLTLLTRPAVAPMVQMQLPQIKDRVNACYGYNAISRITLTQTAATGFAEGQAEFSPAPKAAPPPPDPAIAARAHAETAGVQDETLRAALARLAQNILTRPRS